MSYLNTKRVIYPSRGWIHDEYKNPLNRAHFTNNSNPYKDRSSFKHVMLNSVIERTNSGSDVSDRVEDYKHSRHLF